MRQSCKFSFPKSQRLLKRSEFLKLSIEGSKIRNRHFIAVFRLCHHERKNGIRIGITASKKVGNAVTRNRIKRYIREFIRQYKHKREIPCDVNIIVLYETKCLSLDQIQLSLHDIFERIKRRIND